MNVCSPHCSSYQPVKLKKNTNIEKFKILYLKKSNQSNSSGHFGIKKLEQSERIVCQIDLFKFRQLANQPALCPIRLCFVCSGLFLNNLGTKTGYVP